MRKIKQLLEDFIVREINDIELNDSGKYSYFILKKRNYNILSAIKTIAKKLKINEKNIGFAGNKDKNAITEQFISIKDRSKNIENMQLKDIGLKYVGKGNEEIYLGRLKGNEFIITIRNLTKEDIKKINDKTKKEEICIPNYFGSQRLSASNPLIGKAIIKNNFKEAVDLILKSNSDYNEEINVHLKKQKNDFVGALRLIPFKLLKLYTHSYQSFLFNKTLGQYIETIKNNKSINNKNLINDEKSKNNENNKLLNENTKLNNGSINVKLPIIGFGTELNNDIKKIIENIMEEEKITFRDFIIRAMPDLSLEGDERNTLIRVNDFKIISKEKDELNENKEKITVKFSLPKGSFATVLIDYLFS